MISRGARRAVPRGLAAQQHAQGGLEIRFALQRHVRLAQRVVGQVGGRAGGDVALVAEIVQQGSVRREDRREEKQVPEHRAVAAVVDHPFDAAAFLGDALPYARRGLLVGRLALQETAVAAHRLARRIQRDGRERVVDGDHGVVGLGGIGQHHRLAGMHDGRHQGAGDVGHCSLLARQPALMHSR